MESSITIALTGDVLITKRIPKCPAKPIIDVAEQIMKQEVRFANLETTIRKKEGYPAVFPGGGYAMASPGCLSDLSELYGFNVYNTANNHSMDYSEGALLSTIHYLEERDLLHFGTGENLNEASKAVYKECKNGRVAFLGVVSTFNAAYAAGPQNEEMIGRPGVAPLRHKAIYELDEKNFNDLRRIALDTGINNYMNQAIKEGYTSDTEYLRFGSFEFSKGISNQVHTSPLQEDLIRTQRIICDAKMQSDVVVVSIHSHQFKGTSKTTPTDFCRSFAHECINAGADIVVCHGPHILRGIEQYGKGVIFHGLGDFIFEHESMSALPEEYYRRFGITRQNSTGVAELMNIRSKGGKVGLITDDKAWESVLVTMVCSSEVLSITMRPVLIDRGHKGGLPRFANDTRILHYLKELSKEYNCTFEIEEEKLRAILDVKRQ